MTAPSVSARIILDPEDHAAISALGVLLAAIGRPTPDEHVAARYLTLYLSTRAVSNSVIASGDPPPVPLPGCRGRMAP